MANPFDSIHYNVSDKSDDDLRDVGTQTMAMRGMSFLAGGTEAAPVTGAAYTNHESAARFYLDRIFQRDESPTIRGLVADVEPAVVPTMQLRDSAPSSATNTWTVRFWQTSSAIPIFGSNVVVELDKDKELLAVDGQVADVGNVSPVASASPAEALGTIAALAKVDAAALTVVPAPEIVYFHDDAKGVWHLAYYFKAVPAAPPDFLAGMGTHGFGTPIAEFHPELDYLIDAHDATVIRYWSSHPTVAIPSECVGIDENGMPQKFYGSQANGGWNMVDPMRNIQTCDMAGADLDSGQFPAAAISETTNAFDKHSAAVSAHVNATRVYNFYRDVLVRNGIDDKGMQLVSYVNCVMKRANAPPEWRNAAWYKNRMLYGQLADAGGTLKSYSRYLDVIAHELTHGVTESTSALAYMDQSGALNESFSDIFGIIVKNWDLTNPNTGGDVSTWNWEIGSGLAKDGNALRNFRDPAALNHPDHMNKYDPTTSDNGGVHTNSNIHNKAAYGVLTAKDGAGSVLFTPREAALLYYLTLTRLFKLSSFAQARDTLLNVASVYYSGSPARQQKLAAITAAYNAVGL